MGRRINGRIELTSRDVGELETSISYRYGDLASHETPAVWISIGVERRTVKRKRYGFWIARLMENDLDETISAP